MIHDKREAEFSSWHLWISLNSGAYRCLCCYCLAFFPLAISLAMFFIFEWAISQVMLLAILRHRGQQLNRGRLEVTVILGPWGAKITQITPSSTLGSSRAALSNAPGDYLVTRIESVLTQMKDPQSCAISPALKSELSSWQEKVMHSHKWVNILFGDLTVSLVFPCGTNPSF